MGLHSGAGLTARMGLQGSRPHKVSPAAAALPLTLTPPSVPKGCPSPMWVFFFMQVHAFSVIFFFFFDAKKSPTLDGLATLAHMSIIMTDGEKPEWRQSVWEIHPGLGVNRLAV